MIADLYICDRTFVFNGNDSDNEVCGKIVCMSGMFNAISKHKDENRLQIQTEHFLETPIFSDGLKIKDVIWVEGERKVSRDVTNILLKLLSFTHCSFTYDDMMEVLSPEYENEDSCNAIVAMNKIDTLPDSRQVLYDECGFYKFRRHYIGKYPKNACTFLRNAGKYFDNIVFNKDSGFLVDRIRRVLDNSEDIIRALSALNDYFPSEYLNKEQDGFVNINNFLNAFARKHGMDGGSTEGGVKKDELYCSFEGRKEQCYCGAHMKFYPRNKQGRNNHLRIYFCWDNNNVGKVYVGLICMHV